MSPLQPAHHAFCSNSPDLHGCERKFLNIISFPLRRHFLCLQPAFFPSFLELSPKEPASMFHSWDRHPQASSRKSAPPFSEACTCPAEPRGPGRQHSSITPFLMHQSSVATTSAEGVRCWPEGSPLTLILHLSTLTDLQT